MRDRRMKLIVIIVNFNTAGPMMQCLKCLLRELVDIGARVIVVDNYSQDNSVATLQDWTLPMTIGMSSS